MESTPKPPTGAAPGSTLSRRTVFAGAGAVGAAGALAAATSLPGVSTVPAASGPSTADAGGGYHLTDHIKRYYATARL